MFATPPTAVFVLRGHRPLTIEVQGEFDSGAAVGFRALVPTLVGAQQVTIDLARCVLVDAAAERALTNAVQRIEAGGGTAVVHRSRPAVLATVA